MNPCIKTGAYIVDKVTDLGYYGDLFFLGGMFQLRGVPYNSWVKVQLEDTKRVHAFSENEIIMSKRAESSYADSNLGLELTNPSPEFMEHIRRWYPELIDKFS